MEQQVIITWAAYAKLVAAEQKLTLLEHQVENFKKDYKDRNYAVITRLSHVELIHKERDSNFSIMKSQLQRLYDIVTHQSSEINKLRKELRSVQKTSAPKTKASKAKSKRGTSDKPAKRREARHHARTK